MKTELESEILVIEDEEDMRGLLKEILSQEGYTVVDAADAFEAMKLLEVSRIPLVLCDITMPKMSGLELIRILRQKAILSSVVMLTAHSESDRLIEALQLGAIDYMVKPIEIEELLKKIPGWLEIGKRTRELSVDHQARMIELLRLRNSTD